MKWFAVIILVVVIVAITPKTIFEGNPAGITIGGIIAAWLNPVDPSLDSVTVNAMLEIKSYITAMLIVAIPCFFGGLTILAVMRGKE